LKFQTGHHPFSPSSSSLLLIGEGAYLLKGEVTLLLPHVIPTTTTTTTMRSPRSY